MNRITKAKGYAQRRCDRRVISEQKDIVLEKLIAIGKRMGKLRYLMLVFLCISLCLYHFMDHVCKYLHLRRRIPKGLSKGLHKGMPRVFACYMAMVFVVTSTDLTAFAQEDNGTEILNQQTASIEALPEEQGTIVVQNPETTDGQPETTEDQSEAIEGQSETTDSQPDAIEGQPDTIEGQPEVTDGRSDAIEGQPEVTDSQSYAIEGQPETTEGQLEATEKQPEVSEPQQETTSATETSEEEQAPFSQNVIIDGISISVYAPVGVFPVGAILHVEKITNHAVVEEIEQMVSNHKSEQRIDESYTFDIQIRDEAGQEIEPDTSRGQVEVTFQNVNVMNTEEQETSVYYVADELNQVEEIKSNFNIENDSVSINAEHFSIYTVVITTAVNKETILKYYQASTIQDSYFTIYTAEELSAYKELLDKYVYYRTLNGNAQVETILVNGDDANPMEGITGVGQAANIKLSQLNLSAKVMDNITLEDAHWSPIYILPSEYYITGSGKTITFKNKSGYASENNLVHDLGGILDNIILVNGADYAKRREIGLLPETGLYATITVRVDGLKADIGKAITGAEALAISCDGENYITLERFDDMSIYRTPMDNLEVGAVYHVYYAYENQNGTISGATLTNNTPLEELTEGVNINLDYVSVRYDLEGANTFRRNGDGTLSEDVMASVRVNVQPDGTYKAQEDYEAVIKPAEGFTIPSFSKHVMISIGGHELNYNAGDFSYSISDATEEGTIRIGKEKITDSILMKVEADKIEDFGKNRGFVEYQRLRYGQRSGMGQP